ncbi:MAG TPA: hypothetical protein VF896_06825 [Anaerolineales bacterium]
MTQRHEFGSNEALALLQQRHTIDYGSHKNGSRRIKESDRIHRDFFIDYFHIVGRPMRPICHPELHSLRVDVCFKSWSASYTAKHYSGLTFELSHRTFRLGSCDGSPWFIVMHPKSQLNVKAGGNTRRTAVEKYHALELCRYIKECFRNQTVFSEVRIEESWNLSTSTSQSLTWETFSKFQKVFMDNWSGFIDQHKHDRFWLDNSPAFHTYLYGQNERLENASEFAGIAPEELLRPEDEGNTSSSDSSSDGESSQHGERSAQPSSSVQTPERPAGIETLPALVKLRDQLEKRYQIKNIDHVSYALAMDISIAERIDSDFVVLPMLVDRKKLNDMYDDGAERGRTFYPLAFNQRYGNFGAGSPPPFLSDGILSILSDNLAYLNNGYPILSCSYFQAYSSIKKTIRHHPDDLLLARGIATAALSLDPDIKVPSKAQAKQSRLLEQISGNSDSPTKPFARERHQLWHALEKQAHSFRLEQVLSVDVGHLDERHQTFSEVLRPMIQLVRFYLDDHKPYSKFLRCMKPEIFPTILIAFARVFELALDGMHSKFASGVRSALNVSQSEGVSALDRLGCYCFTGSPKVLMPTMFRHLGTMDSLTRRAWPYIDAKVLDLRGCEKIPNIQSWPLRKDGLPVLMHISALRFHYGDEVASLQHNMIRFLRIQVSNIDGIFKASEFIRELFSTVWITEMQKFVHQHLNKALNRAGRRSMNLRQVRQHKKIIDAWLGSENPFAKE